MPRQMWRCLCSNPAHLGLGGSSGCPWPSPSLRAGPALDLRLEPLSGLCLFWGILLPLWANAPDLKARFMRFFHLHIPEKGKMQFWEGRAVPGLQPWTGGAQSWKGWEAPVGAGIVPYLGQKALLYPFLEWSRFIHVRRPGKIDIHQLGSN